MRLLNQFLNRRVPLKRDLKPREDFFPFFDFALSQTFIELNQGVVAGANDFFDPPRRFFLFRRNRLNRLITAHRPCQIPVVVFVIGKLFGDFSPQREYVGEKRCVLSGAKRRRLAQFFRQRIERLEHFTQKFRRIRSARLEAAPHMVKLSPVFDISRLRRPEFSESVQRKKPIERGKNRTGVIIQKRAQHHARRDGDRHRPNLVIIPANRHADDFPDDSAERNHPAPIQPTLCPLFRRRTRWLFDRLLRRVFRRLFG